MDTLMEEPASKCRILQSKNSVCATVQRFDSYVGCLQELATELFLSKFMTLFGNIIVLNSGSVGMEAFRFKDTRLKKKEISETCRDHMN